MYTFTLKYSSSSSTSPTLIVKSLSTLLSDLSRWFPTYFKTNSCALTLLPYVALDTKEAYTIESSALRKL